MVSDILVAVLLFDAPSDFNRMRDREIGWSTEQCRERRKHIGNNSRFLVGQQYRNVPNLASKVLSLTTERISQDWLRAATCAGDLRRPGPER